MSVTGSSAGYLFKNSGIAIAGSSFTHGHWFKAQYPQGVLFSWNKFGASGEYYGADGGGTADSISTYADGPSTGDGGIILTGTDTSWYYLAVSHVGGTSVYTYYLRKEGAATFTTFTRNTGTELSGLDSFAIFDDYFGSGTPSTACSFFLKASALSGSAILTISQSLSDPGGCHTFLRLTNAASAATNTGSGGSWSASGTLSNGASEPNPAIAGVTYTLTAAQGSLAVTGQAAALKRGRKVVAAQGSLALTGQAATLTKSGGGPTFTLSASGGTYALTGYGGTVSLQYRLSAAGGSVGLAGQVASLRRNRRLNADQGSIALTGQVASLKRNRTLTAAGGTASLTGQAASLKRGRRLGGAQGSFAVAGNAANFVYSGAAAPTYKLTAASGAFALGGQSASPRYGRRLAAGGNAFAVVGNVANFTYAEARRYVLTASGGACSISGRQATFIYSGYTSVRPPRHRTWVGQSRSRVAIGRP